MYPFRRFSPHGSGLHSGNDESHDVEDHVYIYMLCKIEQYTLH